jgi:hypothetical protein
MWRLKRRSHHENQGKPIKNLLAARCAAKRRFYVAGADRGGCDRFGFGGANNDGGFAR